MGKPTRQDVLPPYVTVYHYVGLRPLGLFPINFGMIIDAILVHFTFE